MKRSFIYILVIVATVGFVLSKYYLQKDLESVSDNVLNLDLGRYIEETPTDYKELKDSEAIKTNLVIKNTENDNNNNTYTYTLKINDLKGSYRTIKGDVEYYTIFDATGTAIIELKANESLTIYDVPMGATFTLEQNKNNNYITKVNNQNVTIVQGTLFTDNSITFENLNKQIKQVSPNTKDNIIISVVILTLSLITYFSLSQLKIKKFENN